MDKNLKYGLIATALIGTGYLIFSGGDSGGSTEDPTGNGDILDAGSGPATTFNAENVAAGLYEAMRYSGTKRERVFSILTPVTQTQFGQVAAKFGRRSYNRTLGNQINPFPPIPLELVDLQGWLYEELSDDDYETLRMKYPNYL